MLVALTNAQREAPVDLQAMERLARCAVRRLEIRQRGRLAVTFVGSQAIRSVNQRFLRHNRITDVITFRYDGRRKSRTGPRPEEIVGEILIAPAEARRYARTHGVRYRQELARYVVHGLLHWLGHDDQTPTQQRQMRRREDRILMSCGVLTAGQGARDEGRENSPQEMSRTPRPAGHARRGGHAPR